MPKLREGVVPIFVWAGVCVVGLFIARAGWEAIYDNWEKNGQNFAAPSQQASPPIATSVVLSQPNPTLAPKRSRPREESGGSAIESSSEPSPAHAKKVDPPKPAYDFALPCGDKALEIQPHTSGNYPEGTVGVTILVKATGCTSAWVVLPKGYRPFKIKKREFLNVFWNGSWHWTAYDNDFDFSGEPWKGADTPSFRVKNDSNDMLMNVLVYDR